MTEQFTCVDSGHLDGEIKSLFTALAIFSMMMVLLLQKRNVTVAGHILHTMAPSTLLSLSYIAVMYQLSFIVLVRV